jgi:hypothetical protein
MKARHGAEHYRGTAAHFQVLAELEQLPGLRRRLRRLATEHDEVAADLEAPPQPGAPSAVSG